MSSDSPVVPRELLVLIERGLWPATAEQARSFTFDAAVVQSIAPDEREICLQSPPFRVLDGLAAEWFDRFRRAEELPYETALVLGDFGIGSDNVIVLDTANTPPPVKALVFTATPNPDAERRPFPDGAPFHLDGHWIVLAPTVEEFASRIGLRPAE